MIRLLYSMLVVACCFQIAHAGTPDENVVVVADVAYYGDQAPDDYARSRCRLDVWYPNESPPCLCIAGDNDLPARMEENVYCAAAFKAAGNEQFQCQIFPGRDHGTIMSRIEDADDAVADAMIGFIQAHNPSAAHSSGAAVGSTR